MDGKGKNFNTFTGISSNFIWMGCFTNQSHVCMKPTIINHPFRTITLGYVSEAPLSKLEEEAIEKYTRLHTESHQLQQLITHLLKYYTTAVNTQQQCRNDFNTLSSEYLLVSPMLHYFEEGSHLQDNEVDMVDEDERVCYDMQPLFTQLDVFQNSYEIYAEGLKAAENEHINMVQQQEELEKHFDDFDDNYFSPIIKNYESMEIDIVYLDEDFDNFRGAFTDLTKLSDTLCDTRNAFVEQHLQLYNEIVSLNKDLTNLFTALNKMDRGQ